MTEEASYSHAQLNAKVGQVMQALMEHGDNRVDAELCLDALAFVASVILDMDPNVSARSHLRRAAEQHGSVVLRYLTFLRAHFERTGIHFGDQIGGAPHDSGDLPPGHRLH